MFDLVLMLAIVIFYFQRWLAWLVIVFKLAGNTICTHRNLKTFFVQGNFCSLEIYLLNSIHSCF